MIENSKCVCEHRRHDHLQDGSDYYGCFACVCLSFRLTQPLKDEINYLQAISGHCFICHATWKGLKSPCDLEQHMQQAVTMCSSKCPEEYSKENPYNKMNQPPDPKLSIVEEFDKKFFQDMTGEKVAGYLAMRIAYHAADGAEYVKIAIPDDVKRFLLAALEAHGKAEYERGSENEAEAQGFQVVEREKIAHAAGFTEGIEKAIAAIKSKKHKKPYGPDDFEDNDLLDEIIEALKPKTKKPYGRK